MFSIGSKSCHYAIIRVLQQGLGVINPTLLLLYFYLIQSNIEQLNKYHKKVFWAYIFFEALQTFLVLHVP